MTCEKGIWDSGWMAGLAEGRAEAAERVTELEEALRAAARQLHDSSCPVGWTEEQHLGNPRINCVTARESNFGQGDGNEGSEG